MLISLTKVKCSLRVEGGAVEDLPSGRGGRLVRSQPNRTSNHREHARKGWRRLGPLPVRDRSRRDHKQSRFLRYLWRRRAWCRQHHKNKRSRLAGESVSDFRPRSVAHWRAEQKSRGRNTDHEWLYAPQEAISKSV